MRTFDMPDPKITLVFVAIDDLTVQATIHAAHEQNWSVTTAVFDTYISARRRPHIPEALRAGDGCVALIDFDTDKEHAGDAATYLQQIFGHRIVIIALSTVADLSAVRTAMRSGCTEFLTRPLETHAVADALSRAASQLLQQHMTPGHLGSILALLGAKGGVGTTTLGVHLAIFLVQKQKKVLLIDSKAQFGHASIYLGMDGSHCHFQEVVSNVNRLDSELLKAFVGQHESGLHVLSSPDLGQTARPMHPDDVALTLNFLCSEYDFVIVDCDDSGDEVTRSILAASSQVYLVATPDITAIRDLSRHVDDLSRVEDASQIQVVINRYSSQFAVSLEEIEKAIRMPVSFSVPNNYVELVRSANLGEPVSAASKSGFTEEILRWAHTLIGSLKGAEPAKASDPLGTHLVKSCKTFFAKVIPLNLTTPLKRKRA